MTGYWSNISMMFFLLLGLYSVYTISEVKHTERINRREVAIYDYRLLFLTAILVIVASFRMVTNHIGGTDTPNYITLFNHCNDSSWQNWNWYLHTDIGFRYFTKLIRLLTNDYHIYFIIIYSLQVVAILLFLIEFLPRKSNYIPCILLIFLYWRSMTSIRSNVAGALMMYALVFLNRKRYFWMVFFAISMLLVHKMSFVFFMFFPVYFYRKKLTIQRGAILIFVLFSLVGVFRQYFLLFFQEVDLGGAYQDYVYNNVNSDFGDNFWKIAFEQMILGFFMVINYKGFNKHIQGLSKDQQKVLLLVWFICLFDLISIPICFALNIWRGYEFLYIPRIVMWCEILYLTDRKMKDKSNRLFVQALYLMAFSGWLWFRFYKMYESSNLMPYIFEPLY